MEGDKSGSDRSVAGSETLGVTPPASEKSLSASENEQTPPVPDDEISLPPVGEQQSPVPKKETEPSIRASPHTPVSAAPASIPTSAAPADPEHPNTPEHPPQDVPVSITPKLKTLTPQTIGSLPPDTASETGGALSDKDDIPEPDPLSRASAPDEEEKSNKSTIQPQTTETPTGVLSKPQTPSFNENG